ncbi:hypothetical protein [Tardiphaga sp.]|uniref:hypothetical protein n=1 Tax=Tardiphaga sp. TaxID=1926292 RepID=UPI0025E1A0D0|nr:hypothetical protein [Tardiphaga sp.]
MTGPAVAETFANIFTTPPSLDFAMLVVGDDLKQLEKRVDQFEIEMIRWRATLLPKLEPAFEEIKRTLPVGREAEETVSDAIKVVEDGIAAFSEPLHSDPAVAERIHQLGSISANAGKFVRKLMRGIEKSRVAQHAFFIDMYYGLLAFKSELNKSPEERQNFDDAKKLGAFLRSQIA